MILFLFFAKKKYYLPELLFFKKNIQILHSDVRKVWFEGTHIKHVHFIQTLLIFAFSSTVSILQLKIYTLKCRTQRVADQCDLARVSRVHNAPTWPTNWSYIQYEFRLTSWSNVWPTMHFHAQFYHESWFKTMHLGFEQWCPWAGSRPAAHTGPLAGPLKEESAVGRAWAWKF